MLKTSIDAKAMRVLKHLAKAGSREYPNAACIHLDPYGFSLSCEAFHYEWRQREPLFEDAMLAGCVQAKTLVAALAADGKALTTQCDGDRVLINGVAMRFAEPIARFSVRPDTAAIDAALDQQFHAAVQRVRPAVAVNDIRPALNCFRIDLHARRLIATDGHRLHLAQSTATVLLLPVVHGLGDHPLQREIAIEALGLEVLAFQPARLRWQPPKDAEQALHDRSKGGTYELSSPSGSSPSWRFVATPYNGSLPDPDRVLPPPPEERIRAAVAQAVAAIEESAPNPPRLEPEVPVLVQFGDIHPTLSGYLKALRVDSRKTNFAGVYLDVEAALIRSGSSTMDLRIDCQVECPAVPTELEAHRFTDHFRRRGVNAHFLLDAFDAVGPGAAWDVGTNTVWRASDGKGFTAIVAAMRL